MFSEKDGFPKRAFPNGWKGESGLYAVGFTKRGLLGASMDAIRIASDIEQSIINNNKAWSSNQQHHSTLVASTNPHQQ